MGDYERTSEHEMSECEKLSDYRRMREYEITSEFENE